MTENLIYIRSEYRYRPTPPKVTYVYLEPVPVLKGLKDIERRVGHFIKPTASRKSLFSLVDDNEFTELFVNEFIGLFLDGSQEEVDYINGLIVSLNIQLPPVLKYAHLDEYVQQSPFIASFCLVIEPELVK